ncbi:LytR C-terminal domain-containing protein [Streptomyces palmae]|uniref:LytR family transcriptional regulator n=1 Tax=Streptomyces palmae TaxID=1701085 RepID=A0A4Z0G386_9ACTN|nr:LytR C-terminal domain-containing protein [Streptomyces palmae]TGA89128.1 LytR family transcriptional regulator [Streptomyces palmae]
MSMLTPPGMGGKYRITGNRYPRMRRPRGRRRLVLAGVGAALSLGLVGWGTVQLIDVFTGGSDTAQAAGRDASHCRKAPAAHTSAARAKALPKPGQITVNVYNATKRSGLAKDTADVLKKRGFRIGKVGNAPAAYDKKVKEPGLLLGAPSASQGAFEVLGTQLAGTRTQHDARSGKDVDLILGDRFTDLSGQRDADRALTALAHPAPARGTAGCSRPGD